MPKIKHLFTFITVLIMLLLAPLSIYADGIKVTVDGKELVSQGVIVDGNTLVPIREFVEELGAVVTWEKTTNNITISKLLYRVSGDTNVKQSVERVVLELWVGKKTMLVNGAEVQLDVSPQIINNQTMLPARAVAKWLESHVTWNSDLNTVEIKKGSSNSYDAAFFNNVETQLAEREALGRITGYVDNNYSESSSSQSEVEINIDEINSWVAQHILHQSDVTFEYYFKPAGFYKYSSLSGMVGQLLYATPSFDKNKIQSLDNVPEGIMDGIGWKKKNGVIYLKISDLKEKGILK